VKVGLVATDKYPIFNVPNVAHLLRVGSRHGDSFGTTERNKNSFGD